MSSKNILIFSNRYDVSTNIVMDWIDFSGHDVTRINTDDFFRENSFVSQKITNNHNHICIKSENINLNTENIYSVWSRKDPSHDITHSLETIKNDASKEKILSHLDREYNQGKFSVYSSLKEKKNLGLIFFDDLLKTDILLQAKNFGIKIPSTLITNNKEELIDFYNTQEKVITKTISEVVAFSNQGKSYGTYTELITLKDIKKMSATFAPSLFQEALDKEIEIRTFYLDGTCYSMAMFTQLDKQTNVDFRMYNNSKKSRNIPYKLPAELEVKITKFMNAVNLKTGSLDFIKTKDNRFVFLEVNPWGQYGMVSNPCNYKLNKKIAEYLYS